MVHHGDVGREFFVLHTGEDSVAAGGIDVAVLTEGKFFGELALLDSPPRAATATTLTPSQVLRIDEQRFWALLETIPQRGLQVMVGLARRLREADERPWQ